MTTLAELESSPESGERLGSSGCANGERIEWFLSGNAEVPDRPKLGRLLQEVHHQMVLRAAMLIQVDLRGLRFMNSSCYKDFVTWLASIKSLPPERQYRVHFRTNPKARWQQTGMRALATSANTVVTIE